MANAQGGTLLIGVEDDDEVTGLHTKHRGSQPELLAALIANRTIPPPTAEATFEQTAMDNG